MMRHTPVLLAAERRSQEVTDWAERLGWTAGLLLVVAGVYWLMREGWQWRATLQGDLPALPALPGGIPGETRLRLTGRYHGTTTAGHWLDRIVAHGLGARSRAELTLTGEGVRVERAGAPGFLIPAERIRGARLERAIAGKVLTEGALLVITWEHGERLLDSGFRSEHAAEHAAWTQALGVFTPDQPAGAAPRGAAASDDEEGAR